MSRMGVVQCVIENCRNQDIGAAHPTEISTSGLRQPRGPLIHVFEGSQANLDEDGLAIGASEIRFEGVTEAPITILIGSNSLLEVLHWGLIESHLKDPSFEETAVNKDELASSIQHVIHGGHLGSMHAV